MFSAKLHELVLFNNIFVQLFWSTYGSFFLVFPSRSDICYLWYSNWFKNETSLTLEANSEAYSEPCQTSKIEVFAQIVNGFWFLTIFAKSPILDVWSDSEFASEASYNFAEKAPSQMIEL